MASDTKAVVEAGIRRSTNKRKILKSDNAVCAVAGVNLAADLADGLLAELRKEPNTSTERLLEQSRLVFNTHHQLLRDAMHDSRIIVAARESGVPKLWYVSLSGSKVFVEPAFDGYLTAGDHHNPAIGLIQMYYQDCSNKSVESLKLLVAHAVIEGSVSNPTYVDGLDVLVWKNGENEKPYFLKDTELNLLREHSKSLHDTLAAEIFKLPSD